MSSGKTAAVGLVGGIGSGKSAAARIFAELGVPALDLDDVGRELTAPGQVGLTSLVSAFGPRILQDNGTLDRPRLSALAFANGRNLKRLTDILHPLIWEREKRWLAGLSAPYAVIEAVVLLESEGSVRMDVIVAVISRLELRRQRVISRGHPPISRFEDIVKTQCMDEDRIKAADFIIHNNSSLQVLRSEVERTHQRLLKRDGPVTCVNI